MSEDESTDDETAEGSIDRSTQLDDESNATSHASSNFKVLGEADLPDGTGVLGHNTATSGVAYGVEGVTDSADTEAAGVYGEATQTSGWTYGVHAVTNADYLNAAAVRAEATAGAQGLFAESTGYTGVAGATKAGGEAGVFGINNADTNVTGTGYGVRGLTDSTGADSAGVYGETTQASGQTYGVRGKTRSDDAGAAGVKGVADGSGVGVRAESTSGVGLEVRGFSTSGDNTPTPSEHAALIYDEEFFNSSVLAVQTNDVDPLATDRTNFITFYDGDDTALGAVESNGTGSLVYTSGGADYGEFLPRRDPDEELAAGDVVGVVGGAVTKDAAGADRAMVVSDRSVVAGNAPGQGDAREGYETVAFVGQVPTKVRGSVNEGDLVVPSGEGDGVATAIDPAAWRPGTPVVGQAWEGSDEAGVSAVTVAVGVDGPAVVGEAMRSQRERIDDLEAENDALRERLDAMENRLGAVEADDMTSRAPADD